MNDESRTVHTFEHSPEQRLIAAMLLQAFEDLRVGGSLQGDALRWLQECADVPWSFAWCCEALRLNTHAVRCEMVLTRSVGGNRRMHVE